MGIRSSVGCPIVVAGRLWGVIAASSKERGAVPRRNRGGNRGVHRARGHGASRTQRAGRSSRPREPASSPQPTRRDGASSAISTTAPSSGSCRSPELRPAQWPCRPELAELSAELGRVADELDGSMDDLREISRGIHPAILSEGGLGPALRTLARRSAVPVELEVRADARFPDQVEVAAYYVMSEALTNVAKHSGASAVNVALSADDGVVRLAIRDNGLGGADPRRGSGLVGLKDRVEATRRNADGREPLGRGNLARGRAPGRRPARLRLQLAGRRTLMPAGAEVGRWR